MTVTVIYTDSNLDVTAGNSYQVVEELNDGRLVIVGDNDSTVIPAHYVG